MKKFLFLAITVLCSLGFMSCDDDKWTDGDPSMEHIYYFGFEDWGGYNNKVEYTVKKDQIVKIPVQFFSERVRSYDVVTYYYASSKNLTYGEDYLIVDEKGNTIEADENGAYIMHWPQAEKGVQNVYVKTLRDTPKYIYDESNVNKEGLTEDEIEAAIKKEKERIKSLNTFNVLTFDPSVGKIAHPDNITNSKTNDYEVRSFSQNYKVNVVVK
ncbi:hypothetical protein [Dysgonomonas massiliensis]|uniref:hypothetical protein n=1 Tax=Dysgonomonas massiliensis TaxID=2040292 RepID=UPI0011AF57A9|nr:hypothetical protein [Dysgonomonas massiliensis]